MNKLTEKQVAQLDKKIAIGDSKYIVLIDMTSDKKASENECNANIYCVDNENNILWQVNDAKGMYAIDPFIYMDLADSGNIVARRFFGKRYSIEISSGVAGVIGWEK